MNRRDVIKTLSGGVAGLPAVSKIERMSLQPGDTIVLKYDRPLSTDTANRLKEVMESKFPGHKVIVLGDGMDIKIIEAK